MATKSFTFHTDPGHGWLEVSMHDMRDVGLEPHSFSRYSYRQRNVFYLEEDCDASKFIAAWEAKHGKGWVSADKYATQSFIRNLPSIY
jgi:hypothetical protein